MKYILSAAPPPTREKKRGEQMQANPAYQPTSPLR